MAMSRSTVSLNTSNMGSRGKPRSPSRPRLSAWCLLAFLFYLAYSRHGSSAHVPDKQTLLENPSLVEYADRPVLLDGQPLSETIRWYPAPAREYSRRELLADRVVNFAGLILACIGVSVLLVTPWEDDDSSMMHFGIWLHGACFLLMAGCSAAFHYWAWDWRNEHLLLIMDHFGINAMIVGCYTPMLIQARCFSLLRFIWACAIMGFVGEAMMYVTWKHGMHHNGAGVDRAGSTIFFFHTVRYLLMGWSIICVWSDVIKAFSLQARALILIGGIAYTVGVPFHLCVWLEFHHAIWHLFALIGSVCFYCLCYTEIVCGPPHGNTRAVLSKSVAKSKVTPIRLEQ